MNEQQNNTKPQAMTEAERAALIDSILEDLEALGLIRPKNGGTKK